MLNLSKDQLFERWDLVPENLREAMLSEVNSDFIWKTAQDENVPEEKIYDVAKVVGYVFMGFLHPEDMARELKERLDIDSRTANDIEDAVNKRIFAPLRSDIDKVYKPLSKTELTSPSIPLAIPLSSGPVILKDIGGIAPITAAPRPLPTATAQATLRTLTGVPTINSNAIPNKNIVPAAPKTNRLSDVGWSRSGSSDPVIKLDISPAPKAVAPAPIGASPTPKQQNPTPTPQQTGAPMNHSLGEFERLNAMKKPAVPASTPTAGTPTPAPVTPASEPAPFILHQDSSFKAQEKNSAFTLTKPGADAHVQMNTARPPTPVRPAVLEFGQANGQAAPKPAMPSPAPSKTIHYTEFGAPLSSMPTANTGPRTVSEIAPAPTPIIATPTASVPIPMPPRPPMPPTPPRAPVQPQPAQQQAQQEKVIVKDFL